MSTCRFCSTPLEHRLVDLGPQPSANRLPSAAELARIESGEVAEPRYPLKVMVCGACLLAQLDDFRKAEDLFTDAYVYFSSYSKAWVEHARRYAEAMIPRFGLGAGSLVVEVASNDGYLLQHFVRRGVPCLGIDPAGNTAEAARARGVETLVDFFGEALAGRLAAERGRADLVLGNNVLAHVPDVGDFAAGLAALVKPDGVVTMEFPHLLRLIEQVQFDTVYDEHYSYLSLLAVRNVFAARGLRLFDVEELPTHGGSLRVYACLEGAPHAEAPAVAALAGRERAAGLDRPESLAGFQDRVDAACREFRAFVAAEKARGGRIAAFGAAAKGNTFLNTCGVGREAIDYVVDDTPAKQGRFLPGTHIPVVGRERLAETRPDVIVILPWNHRDEIIGALDFTRAWGTRFVTCIPRLTVHD